MYLRERMRQHALNQRSHGNDRTITARRNNSKQRSSLKQEQRLPPPLPPRKRNGRSRNKRAA